jgi:hypothetical protein
MMLRVLPGSSTWGAWSSNIANPRVIDRVASVNAMLWNARERGGLLRGSKLQGMSRF